jgi:hypothetical protein
MMPDAQRNRPLDATIAVVGAALLLSSFGGWTVDHYRTETDAWHGSRVWWGPIAVGLVAAMAWLLRPDRIVRGASAAGAMGAAVWAVAYSAVQGSVRYERAGYLGIGLLVALALLTTGDLLRRRTSLVQIAVSIVAAEIAALSALSWWVGFYRGNGAFTLWQASTVWTVTALVAFGGATLVLVLDSRGTRVMAAASTSVAAGWVLAYTLPLPFISFPAHRTVEPTTVAIARFTRPPLQPSQFQRDHLVAARGYQHGTVEYALAGVWVIAALAAVLVAAAVVGLRRRAR